MHVVLAELRSAARRLRRAPAVTVSATLCLGLGLGATTAIASAIDRALLEPLPFRAPARLVVVYRTTPRFDTGPFSAPNYLDLARETRQLASLAVLTPRSALLSLPDGATRVSVMRVSGNVFRLLGVPAAHGRLLGPADDEPGQNPVVVLSNEIWRERFGADPAVVGRTIRVDDRATTVVGVLPPDFHVPRGGDVMRSDLWVAMRFSDDELHSRGSNFLWAIGRLARGATAASAQSELRALFAGIVDVYPELRGDNVRVEPLRADAASTVRAPLLMMFGAVCMVLLIAATNVASLLLARGVHQRREMAVRVALGAGRWRVMRPVLTETLLLAGVGVSLGLALAWLGVRTIGALAAERLPQLAGLSVDLRVIGFALGLSLVVAVACGVVPAWRGASVDPQDALSGARGAGAGRAQHRALGTLVIAEVALSLILLVGAGLVLKGFTRLMRNDPGFDPTHLLALRVTIAPERYPDSVVERRFLEPAIAAIRSIPGVVSAGSISLLPYDNWGWNFGIRYEGQPDDPTKRQLVEVRVVTPSFFEVTGQRLLAGRLLRQSDDARPGVPAVVVVNEALAKRDFAGADPVGKRFYTGDTTFATIVGVVSDIRNVGPYHDPMPEADWTYAQQGFEGSYPILVRVRGDDPLAVARAVRAAILQVDAGAAITEVRPMTEVIAKSVGRPRFYLTLLATFAGVALLLAIAGLYGVMSYAVAQRTRDLGIRNALGAPAGRVIALVTGMGMRLVALGLVLGVAGGAMLTRLLRSMLYGVSPLDLSTWILASVALTLAALAATLVPARRATRVDPIVAMRAE